MKSSQPVDIQLRRIYPFLLGYGAVLWQHDKRLRFPVGDIDQFCELMLQRLAIDSLVILTSPWHDFTIAFEQAGAGITMSVAANLDGECNELQSITDLILSEVTLPFRTEAQRYVWAYCCGLAKKRLPSETEDLITLIGSEPISFSVKLLRASDLMGLTMDIDIEIYHQALGFIVLGTMGRANIQLHQLLNQK